MIRYYIDACIWRDYFENRSDRFRPLGDWAFELLKNIIENEDSVVISDLVEEELLIYINKNEVIKLISLLPEKLIIRTKTLKKQLMEAINLSRKLNTPRKDTLHAILARDSNAILVTRDKHFVDLLEIVDVKKPEDLL